MKYIFLFLFAIITGCGLTHKHPNLFSNLNECFLKTNTGGKELKLNIDSSIVFFKSELGITTKSLFLIKKDFQKTIKKEHNIDTNRFFSLREAELLRSSTYSSIPFCLEKIVDKNCKEIDETKCIYLQNLNTFMQIMDDSNFKADFDLLVNKYPKEIIEEKEIVYILLFTYYMYVRYMQTSEVPPRY